MSPQIARAYGLNPATTPSAGSAKPPLESAALKIASHRIDSYRSSQPANKLVAGSVAQPVNFDVARTASAHGFQMYTRAADRIEAAVRIELGRAIDLKG
jgi:hypothetical protein